MELPPQVDGIILEADGSDEEQELIQEASDADIPVSYGADR